MKHNTMRQLLPCLMILLFIVPAFAQDTVFVRYNKEWSDEVKYTTDTLIFGSPMQRDMLIGTTLVPSGRKYSLMPYGLQPQKVEFAPCDGAGEYSGDMDRVEDITFKDSTLTVRLKIHDNCCYSFLCEATADYDTKDGIINLTYTGYVTHCSCNCCFGLTYVFHYEKVTDTIPIEGVMINGNKKTLKKIKMP
jgi:hypothetical protein